MKHGLGSILLAGGFVTALVCAGPVARADVLTLTSSQIQDNGTLAIKNACADTQRSPNCVGQNISPPLAWSGVPDGTKSFALLLFDPEGRAPAGVSHMVLYGIPASVTSFAEGELSQPSEKFVGGKSTMEKAVYFGPGTPPGTDWHHYTFTLIATDLDPKAPELKPGMTREELAAVLGAGPNSHVKGAAGLVTRFKHP
jgi:Raf kinase inhibitor-like YbhB/YbcL family protein